MNRLSLYVGYILQTLTSNILSGRNTARQHAKLSNVGYPPPKSLPFLSLFIQQQQNPSERESTSKLPQTPTKQV